MASAQNRLKKLLVAPVSLSRKGQPPDMCRSNNKLFFFVRSELVDRLSAKYTVN
jgi:hypothetical protein